MKGGYADHYDTRGWQKCSDGWILPVTSQSPDVLASLAAKVDAFALTLPASEQTLLAQLVNGNEQSVTPFGARPVWPGLLQLVVAESEQQSLAD